jgi:7-cyano-7-deazaguanine synthase
MNVTVLLSGGIDSAACVAFYKAQGRRVSALHVDYGQAARRKEKTSATAIAAYMQVPLRVVTVRGVGVRLEGEVVGRNAFLLTLALQEGGTLSQLIALGIHAGTQYCDCSAEFINLMNTLLGFQTDGRVQVGAPFVTWTKRQVWDYSKLNGIPISLTYSCERGSEVPCGECLSCKDVRRLNAC